MSAWPLAAPPPPPGSDRGSGAPSFAVVIPAFQATATLPRAVESVLAQTVAPAEIVVCDDGSTDDVAGTLAPYGERVRLVQRDNGGEAAAKNTAVGAASAEWVAVLDADDAYLPEYLEAIGAAVAARPDLDAVTCDAWMEVGGRRVRRVYSGGFRFAADDQRRAILHRNFVFGLAAVRRGAWLAAGGFDERIRLMSDWDFFVRLVLGGSRIGCVPTPLAVYSVSDSSLSADRPGMLAGRMEILHKAAVREDLSTEERAVVADSIAETRPLLARERALHALRARDAGATRAALRAAVVPGQPIRTRLKFTGAALAAPVAGRLLRQRPARSAGGTALPTAGADPTAPADARR